jgi:hypothetical protein
MFAFIHDYISATNLIDMAIEYPTIMISIAITSIVLLGACVTANLINARMSDQFFKLKLFQLKSVDEIECLHRDIEFIEQKIDILIDHIVPPRHNKPQSNTYYYIPTKKL